MKANNVLYQYTEKKMGPFGWILISYIITILFLLSITMILGPISAIFQTINIWTILLLLLIPLGGWLSMKVVHYARRMIWQNSHLTTYQFYHDTIQFNQWKNTFDREPTTEDLELAAIQKVVLAPYITNEYRTKHGQKHIESSYILYIIHTVNAEKKLLKTPFPNNYENINIWLTYFREQNVPVQFTTEVLYSYERDLYTDEERLEQIESNIHVRPLDYNGNWKQQQHSMHREWNQQYPPDEYDIKMYGEDKSIFRPIANTVLFTFALMGGITFGLIELSKMGWFAAENPWPIFVMLFLISFLFFFFLRRYLRWYLMLIFIVNVFVFGFAMAMSYEESETVAYQVSENALGMAMLFPLVVWIPYLIVKITNKKN